MTLQEKALKWWAEKTKQHKYVVSSGEIPDQRQRDCLRKRGLIFKVSRGCWILKRPEDGIDDVFPLLYWQAIEQILANHKWSLRGESALLIYIGDQAAQKHLIVKTQDKTNRTISLPLDFEIELRHDPHFEERLIKKQNIAGRQIPVAVPELVLVDVNKFPLKEVQSFIAGTDFDKRMLSAIYATSPKPVIFKRLIGLARDAKRQDLATAIKKIIEDYTHYQVVKKQREESKLAPERPAVLSPPWVIRQEQQAKEFEDVLNKGLKSKIVRIKKQPLDQLLKQAREHKKYDTYHSTSLEGYRITPEEVDVLLSGRAPKEEKGEGADYLEKLKNRMAIVGYSEAFDFILAAAKRDFGKPRVTEDLIKDTCSNLFKPSTDAGVVDYFSLTTYRNMPVYIRGTRYTPPSYEKLPELMASFVQLVNYIKNPVVRAILAHYFFVTIHPYTDGNGRTGRLLMNYLFLSTGYSWVTIKNEQRSEYFEALAKAQLDEGILPFGEFILSTLKEVSKSPGQKSS
ncbi:MAG: Fic family protein [Thermoleophilia bacterium]